MFISTQLVVVLISISIALLAFMMPFTYNFIKNLDTQRYLEIDKAIEVLKIKRKNFPQKSKDDPKSSENLEERIKDAKKQIDSFNNYMRNGMIFLFGFCIVSISCGIFCLHKDTYDYLLAMIYMLCGELLVFIFFVYALTRFMPMKKINDLRDKKISLELDRNKINHDLALIFTNSNNKGGNC